MRKAALTVLLVLVAWQALAQSPEEAAGQAAERAGRLRDALDQYVAALNKALPASAEEQRLREAILTVAKRAKPPPALPEEAERRMARGRAATKAARDEQGYLQAAGEFALASKAAPWLAEAYFNSAVVLDKAGRHADALRDIKLYLAAAPNPADAKQARELMYEIEFRGDKAKNDAVRAQNDPQRQLAALAGRWTGKVITHQERGPNCGKFCYPVSSDMAADIVVEGKTITIRPASNPSYVVVIGTLAGNSLADIQWEMPRGPGIAFPGERVPMSVSPSHINFTVPALDGGSPARGIPPRRLDGWFEYDFRR